jgi:hypothetical protein
MMCRPRWYAAVCVVGAFSALSSCGSRTGLDATVDGSPSDAAIQTQEDAARCALFACALAFPTFDDQCVTEADCAAGLHGCCNQLAIGLRTAQIAVFDAAEATWAATCCATIDCAAQFMCSQEGLVCTGGTKVACVERRCRAKCR